MPSGPPDQGPDQAIEAARELCRAHGVELVVVTLGAEGSIGVTLDQAWRVPPVPVEVVNTAGAGGAFGRGSSRECSMACPCPKPTLGTAAPVPCSSPWAPPTAAAKMSCLLPQVQVGRIG